MLSNMLVCYAKLFEVSFYAKLLQQNYTIQDFFVEKILLYFYEFVTQNETRNQQKTSNKYAVSTLKVK